ncbi:hypothetical protein LO771_13495 [Streptacidiphilus sp. ASG 303]|uniref:hypothetical protein n=1 Tax=Streptacidiphilus sp. ASG 303 TaxID=2896847 RepID=UPI001E5A382A|nr:hypothetical protein [Streptacidiphilus sp. ASG 303]MCD0483389.1 hypothetical protein [Streptacidiphilus sp. ASG 303]
MQRITDYYSLDGKAPRYTGPEELSVLGQWVDSDIQLSPYSVLQVLDLVRKAEQDVFAVTEEFGGNAHTTEISPKGVSIENDWVEHVRGTFTLDQALDVLLDFWEFCKVCLGEKSEQVHREWVAEHGRDPLRAY